MRRLTMWIGLVAVLGLMLGTGQAWAQAPVPVASVPEPGPLIGAGVVTLMGLGYAWLRRKRATA
jgi:MYXO-CTERM domain-containing protein